MSPTDEGSAVAAAGWEHELGRQRHRGTRPCRNAVRDGAVREGLAAAPQSNIKTAS